MKTITTLFLMFLISQSFAQSKSNLNFRRIHNEMVKSYVPFPDLVAETRWSCLDYDPTGKDAVVKGVALTKVNGSYITMKWTDSKGAFVQGIIFKDNSGEYLKTSEIFVEGEGNFKYQYALRQSVTAEGEDKLLIELSTTNTGVENIFGDLVKNDKKWKASLEKTKKEKGVRFDAVVKIENSEFSHVDQYTECFKVK